MPSRLATLGLLATISMPIAATARAQAPAPTPQDPPAERAAAPEAGSEGLDLPTFIKRVRARHWSEERTEAVDRFTAEFLIQNMAAAATAPGQAPVGNIAIRLGAAFVMPRYLRFRYQGESGNLVEQGIDKQGMWLRKIEDGKEQVLDLERAGSAGKELERDRKELIRYGRVARQLLAFLDPAATLNALDVEAGPSEMTLVFGRRKIEGVAIAGRLAQFPFVAQSDEQALARARVILFFDTEDTLIAVRAIPVDKRGAHLAPAEWTWMLAPTPHDGVLLPTRLRVLREPERTEAAADPAELLNLPVEQLARSQRVLDIRIEEVSFASSLKPEHFARGVRSQ